MPHAEHDRLAEEVRSWYRREGFTDPAYWYRSYGFEPG